MRINGQDKIKILGVDKSPEIEKALQNKELLFIVDQQPYHQGYQAIEQLTAQLLTGSPGKGLFTGPLPLWAGKICPILE